MKIRLASLLMLALVLMGLPRPSAQAHPHIWIIATTTLIFKNDQITGIRHEWLFDEIFSANIIHDFDKNKDGKFDARETREIERNAFGNLTEYNFFTHMTVDGAKQPFKAAKDFAVEQRKKQVIYRFTLDLPEPVDPLKQGIAIATFDETYYIEILLAEIDPIRFDGAKGVACQVQISRDESLALAYGVGTLENVKLLCGRGE